MNSKASLMLSKKLIWKSWVEYEQRMMNQQLNTRNADPGIKQIFWDLWKGLTFVLKSL